MLYVFLSFSLYRLLARVASLLEIDCVCVRMPKTTIIFTVAAAVVVVVAGIGFV